MIIYNDSFDKKLNEILAKTEVIERIAKAIGAYAGPSGDNSLGHQELSENHKLRLNAGDIPIYSIGPSGIGGPYQKEWFGNKTNSIQGSRAFW